MSVSEHDLETLESWLDGELSDEQAESLRKRLAVEPQLAQALDRLRGDRQLRAAAWQGIDPSAGEVDSLIAGVRRSIRKQEIWSTRIRSLRNVSGIAAAIVLLFGAGWMSRERLHVGPVEQIPQTVAAVNTTPSVNPPVISAQNPVPLNPQSDPRHATLVSAGTLGGATLRNVPVSPDGFRGLRPTYKILVMDPANNIRFVKELDKIEDAQQFAERLIRMQNEPAPEAGPDGN